MALINPFQVQQRATLTQTDNTQVPPESTVEMHDFFNDYKVVDVLNPMRNRNRIGEVIICPGLLVEGVDGKRKKVYISTALIEAGFGVKELAEEIKNNTRNDIAVVKYKDSELLYITFSKEIFTTKAERDAVLKFFE